jgi:hypothetical protein
MLFVFLFCGLARAQQPSTEDHVSAPPEDKVSATPALPDPNALMLEVERNQDAAEAARREYTYRVHFEDTDLKGDGSVKKTTVTDSDSFTIGGVRVNKVTARDGKPLTPDEAQKENERIDKQVAKAKEAREKHEDKGQATNAQGDSVLTVSRILQLGAFSNIRPGTYAGRPVWLVDYIGDPHAKTKTEFEGVFRDLTGTIWVDQADRALVAAHGEFHQDFKIGGGLIANLHKGTHFDFRATLVDGKVWLPDTIDAEGSLRYLLFVSLNGRIHLKTSDYKRFRTGITIHGGDRQVGPDGQPLPNQPPPEESPATKLPTP